MEWGHIAVIEVTAVASLLGIGKWIGGVNADRKNFHEFMREIRADIKVILNRLPSDNDPSTMQWNYRDRPESQT